MTTSSIKSSVNAFVIMGGEGREGVKMPFSCISTSPEKFSVAIPIRCSTYTHTHTRTSTVQVLLRANEF